MCVMEGATLRAQIKFPKIVGSWNGPCQDARKIAKPKEFAIIWGSSNNVQKTGKYKLACPTKGRNKKSVKPDVSGGQGATLAAFGDGQTPENVGVLSVSPKKAAR